MKTSSDKLENFLLTRRSEVRLLNVAVGKNEVKIPEVCIVEVESDLNEVCEAFRREYRGSYSQLKGVKDIETLELQFQMREEDLLGHLNRWEESAMSYLLKPKN